MERLNPVSLENLDDLKRQYASLIIQIDRLRPALEKMENAPEEESGHSIRELLGHLIDTDRDIWWPRIEAALSEERPFFENIEQRKLLRPQDWNSQQIQDIIAQFVRGRWHFGMQLNHMSPVEFERVGNHETLGELSILRMLQILVAHDELYLAKIRAALIAARLLREDGSGG